MKSCSNCKYKDGCGGACPAERCAGYETQKIYKQKTDAKQAYKEAKQAYLKNPTGENWRVFCDRKADCMRLGVII